MSAHTSQAGDPTKKRGYYKLALFMTSQKETAIFRRFIKLNLLNLMSLQAELMELEEDFDIAWEADENDKERRKYSVDFNALRKARLRGLAKSKDEPAEDQLEQQWQTLMKIRNTLKVYNDTLLQFAQVNNLNEPEQEDVNTLRSWLERKEYGNGDITGLESKAWEARELEGAKEDLVSVQYNTQEKAPFSSWVTGKLLTLFHNKLGYKLKFFSRPGDPEAGPDIATYEETTLARNTRYFVMVIASLLPVICIVVLNALNSAGLRLGITALFTAAFAVVLVIFTPAKEVEIFASTSAFAAVEVVFIGSTLSSSSGNSSQA